jgi:type IV fimbrial biogenesis protein FimT
MYGLEDNKMILSNQSGFTIIELMIVVAIAGILAVFAMPSFEDTIDNQRIRKAVSDMHLSLLEARSEAIKRNANITINRTSTSWLNGWTVQSGGTVLRTYNALSDKLTVNCDTDANNAVNACPDSITFNRNGRPTSLIDFWVFVAGNDRVIMRCAGVSLSGRPEVVVDSDDDTTNGCN